MKPESGCPEIFSLRQVLQFDSLVHLNANVCGNGLHLRVLSAIYFFLLRVPGGRWGRAPEKTFVLHISPVKHQFSVVPSLHLERLRTRHQLSLIFFRVKLLLQCVHFMPREAGGNVSLWLLLFQKQFKEGLGFLRLYLPSGFLELYLQVSACRIRLWRKPPSLDFTLIYLILLNGLLPVVSKSLPSPPRL